MPPLPPIDVVKIECSNTVTGSGRDWVNIFHLAYSPLVPPLEPDLVALATAFDADYETYLQGFCHTEDTYAASKYTDLSSSTGAVFERVPNVSGGSSGTLAPLSLCAGISWGIARRYRGGHPRTYLSALTTAQVPGPQDLDPTFLANLDTSASTFLTRWSGKVIGAITYQIGAVSYRTANAPRVTPIFEEFNAVAVHRRIDTQRRRLGKEI